jgi:alcohol dehydrogenase
MPLAQFATSGIDDGEMKALVYGGPGHKALENRPIPRIVDPTDTIVRITKTTICGTDLHILKGDVPTCQPGRILGHEGIGVVHKTGSAVTSIKPGDRVLISCITSCAKCIYCRRGMYSHCTNGGWILGHMIDGTQAQYVRIPHGDTSLYRLPQNAASRDDEEALVMLSDIFPTGFECGVLNGRVAPGSSVAIVGAGPVGLAALMTAQLYSPSQVIMVDIDTHRLQFAKKIGATHTVNAEESKSTAEEIRALTEAGRGVDVAIEAVGVPSTFQLCSDIVTAGGVIANAGVHGVKADLHLEKLWAHNISITTRLVDTATTPTLLKMVLNKRIDPRPMITHRFPLSRILEAYDTFENASHSRALKVIIEAS